MLPGPTTIRECSACKQFIDEHTIMSGNTFGAIFWTDGKREAPMLPDQPWLVKCPHCKGLLWIDEQKEVGEKAPYDETENDDKTKNSKPFVSPTETDYLKKLSAGEADPKKIHYLRMRAWWAGNDKRRRSKTKKPLTKRQVENLEAFAKLLKDEDQNGQIRKAEVLRELSRFDECCALLSRPFDAELAKAVSFILDLAKKKDDCVRQLKFD